MPSQQTAISTDQSALYVSRNTFEGKASGLTKLGIGSFVFGFALTMFLTGFVTFTVAPSVRIHLHGFVKHNWPRPLWGSLVAGVYIATVMLIAIVAQLRTFEVWEDRVRVKLGSFRRDILFRDIVETGIIPMVTWPSLRNFREDFAAQLRACGIGYRKLGIAQSLTTGHSRLVFMKVGKRSYLIDVEDPDAFASAVDSAVQRWRAENS